MDIKLLNFLNHYLPFVEAKLPTIVVYGGSGEFAKALSTVFTDMGLDHDFVFIITKNEGSDGGALKDIALRVEKDFLFSSEGLLSGSQLIENNIEIKTKAEFLKELTDRKWNKRFDRGIIPEMEARLNEIPFEFGKYLSGQVQLKDYVVEKVELNDYSNNILNEDRENIKSSIEDLLRVLGLNSPDETGLPSNPLSALLGKSSPSAKKVKLLKKLNDFLNDYFQK